MFSKNSLIRINKDIIEITKNPIEGIGIVSLEDNPMQYIVNIRLMSGIYEGFCLQLLLTFTNNYPINPPKILIYPGQHFDGTYHHHIFEDLKRDEYGRKFYKLCFDLLDNDFLSTKEEHSGWNPSYTISTLLLQIQNFLSNPDMNKFCLPSKSKIEELIKSMDDYERIFIIKNNNKEIERIHTWKNPYPEMYFKTEEEDQKIENKNEINNKDNLINNNNKIIKDNLTCFISRLNYIDDNNLLLGYPIKKIKYYEKIIPIPEILSYDSYMMQLSNKDEINVNRPLNNNIIINIPLINEINHEDNDINEVNDINDENDENDVDNDNIMNNFIMNRHPIFNRFGFRFNFDDLFFRNDNDNIFTLNNNNNYESFKSANNEFYEQWLPIYINEEHYLKNKIAICNSFSIIKYGNLGLKEYDFKPDHIFEILPNILFEMLIKIFNDKDLTSSSFMICFFQYMLLYKKLFQIFKRQYRKYINNYIDKILKNYSNDNKFNNDLDGLPISEKILKIFILFLFANEDFNSKEMQKILIFLKNIKNELCFNLFSIKKEFIMKKPESFIDDLFKKDIFYKIVDLISLNKKYLHDHNLIISKTSRKKIIQKLINNFKEIYQDCNGDLQQKINILILNNLDFSKYFELNYILLNFLDIMKNLDDEISHNFNFFLLFFILKAKICEKNFINNLEKNYGVYLEVDNFITKTKTEINKKKNINEYITVFGKLFGKELSDLLILYTYLKTRKKIVLNTINKIYGKKIYNFENNGNLNNIKQFPLYNINSILLKPKLNDDLNHFFGNNKEIIENNDENHIENIKNNENNDNVNNFDNIENIENNNENHIENIKNNENNIDNVNNFDNIENIENNDENHIYYIKNNENNIDNVNNFDDIENIEKHIENLKLFFETRRNLLKIFETNHKNIKNNENNNITNIQSKNNNKKYYNNNKFTHESSWSYQPYCSCYVEDNSFIHNGKEREKKKKKNINFKNNSKIINKNGFKKNYR